MNRTYKSLIIILPAALALAACATVDPTVELVDARRAFDQAQRSHAAHYAAEEIHEASQALSMAEGAHEDAPGSDAERHYAYLAGNRAARAMAVGETRFADESKMATKDTIQREQLALREMTKKKLVVRGEELDDAQRALKTESAAHAAVVNEKDQELANERDARAEAEAERRSALAETRSALKSLEKIANVKEDARRMVITLSGAVMFTTGKSELLPIARTRLDDVAEALVSQGANQGFEVIGHTDSVGSDSLNQELSQARAEAVRSYLVSRGVDPKRIQAIGRGESEPVADNASAEGRANNRRVEVIVSDLPRS